MITHVARLQQPRNAASLRRQPGDRVPMVLVVDAGARRANACGDRLERLLRGDQLRTANVAEGCAATDRRAFAKLSSIWASAERAASSCRSAPRSAVIVVLNEKLLQVMGTTSRRNRRLHMPTTC